MVTNSDSISNTPLPPYLSEQHKFQSLLNILKGCEEFTLDASGVIISSNLEAVTISGYEEWEVIGKHISLFYSEEDRQNKKPEHDLEKTAKLGKYISSGFRIKKRGAPFWAKMKFFVILKENAEVAGYRVTLFDSTHRAMYTMNTRKIKDEYLSLFNNSFIGIFKIRIKDLSFLMLNEKALQIIGKRRENLKLHQLFHCKEEFGHFTKLLEERKTIEDFEFRLDKDECEVYCTVSCKVFPIGGFVEGILSDTTEKRNRVIQLKKLNEELDNFLYHASHDIRAPLATILGLINLINTDHSLANVSGYIEKITDRVKHMDVLLKDLSHVAFNNSQPVQASVIDAESLIHDVIKPFVNEFPFIHTRVDVQPSSPFYCDSIRLATILNNIVSNAFKYHNPQADTPFVRIIFQCDNAAANILIEDNGCGIDSTYISNIFKSFFKMDSRGRGSGLGLYVVEIMLEKLNGKISVTSSIGKGTQISVVIPNMASFNASSVDGPRRDDSVEVGYRHTGAKKEVNHQTIS